jgi:hypothetical protein
MPWRQDVRTEVDMARGLGKAGDPDKAKEADLPRCVQAESADTLAMEANQ